MSTAASSSDAPKVIAAPDAAKRDEWMEVQKTLSAQVVIPDKMPEGGLERHRGSYVAGMDISFFTEDPTKAMASLVVCSFDNLQEIAYETHQHVTLTEPYIPTFLSFRELVGLRYVWNLFETERPELASRISAILMDGNGILHPRRFGVASHFGVVTGRPTIGVAKTLLYLPGFPPEKVLKRRFEEEGYPLGYNYWLSTQEGETVAAAIRSTEDSTRPIFVSPGHLFSLQEALAIVRHCTLFRVPEPIRLADLHGRQQVRDVTKTSKSKKKKR